MTKAVSPAYVELINHCREIGHLSAVGSLIGWDQETYMPEAAAAGRADQQALMSGLVHERKTGKRFGELLAQCEADVALSKTDTPAAANIRELRRDVDLASKLPSDLVTDLARATSLAQDAWKGARKESDFAVFLPHLERVLELTRKKAECYGVPTFNGRRGELYDALLNEYEPGISAAEIQTVFAPLQVELSELVARICGSSVKLDSKAAELGVSIEQQEKLAAEVLAAIGFDLKAGRLDRTAHPFCSNMGPGDVRLTTRYTSASFLEPLSSTLHEAGHGMYEQGLPKGEHFGEPIAEAVSLGIHESQSRMWENFVGRSHEFCSWLLPVAQRHFGAAAKGRTSEALYKASNTVQRSYIRVESDEATYNLHIMLRFGLERDLVSGNLAAKDLPGEWNKRFKALLGIDVPDDRRGCLQDVHWSFGLIGYFPTYTLGNLYAAQFWEKINQEIPQLPAQIGRGEFAPLLTFLRTNIHQHGRRYSATELCKRITGKPLESGPLMRYLKGKLQPLYGLS